MRRPNRKQVVVSLTTVVSVLMAVIGLLSGGQSYTNPFAIPTEVQNGSGISPP